MSDELSREEFYAALNGITKSVDSGFAGVHNRLDRLNGKTEAHGNRITAIETLMKERDHQTSPDRMARGLGLGSILGSIANVIWQGLKQ
jgi:hypothetical protein